MDNIADDEYDVGDRPTLIATFRDKDGDLSDPAGIEFKLLAPDGTVTTQTESNAVNSSTGVWEWTIPSAFDAGGTWVMRAEANSGLQTAEEISVRVNPSAFA